MHIATFAAFHDELQKISTAGLGGHLAEVAGLGILGAPTASKHFGNKEWSEKNKRRAELAGLGVLAVPSVMEIGHHLLKKGSIKLSAIPPGMLGGLRAGMLQAAHAAKPAAQAAQKAVKLPTQAAQAARASHLQSFTPKAAPGASGFWNNPRAISL